MSLLQVFSEMTTQRSRFGQNSCAADEQACMLCNCEFNKHSVLKIFTINPSYTNVGQGGPPPPPPPQLTFSSIRLWIGISFENEILANLTSILTGWEHNKI